MLSRLPAWPCVHSCPARGTPQYLAWVAVPGGSNPSACQRTPPVFPGCLSTIKHEQCTHHCVCQWPGHLITAMAQQHDLKMVSSPGPISFTEAAAGIRESLSAAAPACPVAGVRLRQPRAPAERAQTSFALRHGHRLHAPDSIDEPHIHLTPPRRQG